MGLLRRGVIKGLMQDWEGSMLDLRYSLVFKDEAVTRRFLGRGLMCIRK